MSRQYFSQGGFRLDGSEDCLGLLDMLCIPEALAQTVTHPWNEVPLELDTDANGVLTRVAMGSSSATLDDLPPDPPIQDWWRKNSGVLASTWYDEALGNLSLPGFLPKPQIAFSADAAGPHRLGGPIPDGFTPATTDKPNHTQYVGTLAGDGSIPGLDFDLHLSVPVFDEYDSVTLDYSDPMAPALAEAGRYIQSAWGTIKRAQAAQWEATAFAAAPADTWQAKPLIGVAGSPSFVQGPVLVCSPGTGRPMRFLAQLASGASGPLTAGSIGPVADRYFSGHISFFGDGALFLFWEEDTRLLTCLMQNT